MTTIVPLSGEDLAAAIAALDVDGRTVPVLGKMPDRFTPPAVILTPSSNWMDNTEGLPNGVWTVSYTARVISGYGTNVRQEAILTDLVTSILARLAGSETWTADNVGQPFQVEVRDKVLYLAADITITAYATITED